MTLPMRCLWMEFKSSPGDDVKVSCRNQPCLSSHPRQVPVEVNSVAEFNLGGGGQWEVDAWMRKTLGRGLELDEEDADDAWRRQPNQLSSFQVEFSRSTACVAPIYAKALLKASMQFKILVEDKNYFSQIQIPCCHCPCLGVAPSTQNLSRCLRLKGF